MNDPIKVLKGYLSQYYQLLDPTKENWENQISDEFNVPYVSVRMTSTPVSSFADILFETPITIQVWSSNDKVSHDAMLAIFERLRTEFITFEGSCIHTIRLQTTPFKTPYTPTVRIVGYQVSLIAVTR